MKVSGGLCDVTERSLGAVGERRAARNPDALILSGTR
jgi:hypothetical protein